jgi:hypothetical protein
VCLSVDAESAGEALREAARLLEDGDARFAVAGCVEVGERARRPAGRAARGGRARGSVAGGPRRRAALALRPQAFDELAAFAARGERAGSGAP